MVKHDGKRIGLGHGAITSLSSRSWEAVKKDEAKVHKRQDKNTVVAFSVNLYAAFKLYFLYLITFETILMCFVSVGLTVYWYFLYVSNITTTVMFIIQMISISHLTHLSLTPQYFAYLYVIYL